MSSDGVRLIVRIGIALAAVVALVIAAFDSAIGWMVPITLVGGSLTAVGLLAVRAKRGRVPSAPDSFERGRPFDVMNLSTVRVAGVGGVGLLVAAAGVALQFELTTVALVAGVVGGVCLGGVLIVTRRRLPRRVDGPPHLY